MPAPPLQQGETDSRSAALCLRNYDRTTSYTVTVTALDDDRTAFERRYSLTAGATVHEAVALSPGVYDVRVALDGVPRARRTCRIGAAPEHTALVEVGNGAAALSEGTF